MRKLLVFQHVPFEPLGTLDAQFKEAGFRIRYINFDREPGRRVDVTRYHGLIVLGGPMGAADGDRYRHLEYEKAAIHAAIEQQIPVLGICLGAQLMAAAIGGTPRPGRAIEYGWTEVTPTDAAHRDPLFRHLAPTQRIFQWHEDTFTLPRDAVHLASSETCKYQAFRVGESAYGLQFHLEANRALILRWLEAPGKLARLAQRGIMIDVRQTLEQTRLHLPGASALARTLFGAFIDRFYSFRRRRALPSR
jgi:GMP synthase (glutamine-hydrolysing)